MSILNQSVSKFNKADGSGSRNYEVRLSERQFSVTRIFETILLIRLALPHSPCGDSDRNRASQGKAPLHDGLSDCLSKRIDAFVPVINLIEAS